MPLSRRKPDNPATIAQASLTQAWRGTRHSPAKRGWRASPGGTGQPPAHAGVETAAFLLKRCTELFPRNVASRQPDPCSMTTPTSSALAYESLLAEMLAIPDDHLAGARLDVTAAITAVARLLSTLRGLGPTLESAWHGFDFEQLDRLELCTLALHHAESRLRGSPSDSLCGLIRQKAATLFLQAYDDLQDAVQQLLDPPPLPALRGSDSRTPALERPEDPDRGDDPTPITLVSMAPSERAVA